MENNNGRGIFYGVIGVATLVVAVIGATFAYFTASANSAEDVIKAGGATVNLKWGEVKTGIKSNLVPLNVGDENIDKYIGTSETASCIDDNKNNICSVYQYSVTNEGNAGQQVFASLKVNSNNFEVDTAGSGEVNLKFAVFKGAAEAITFDFGGNGTVTGSTVAAGTMIVPPTSIVGENEIDLSNLDELIPGGQTVTYTVVLWINETNKGQNIDQGKSFSGGIFYTTDNGSNSGITGMLSA